MRISPDDVLAILTTRSIQKKNNMYKMYLAIYILTLIVTLTEGFYLPGLAPVMYCEKSAKINKCQVKMIPCSVSVNFRFDFCFRLDMYAHMHLTVTLHISQFILYSVLCSLFKTRFQRTLLRM